MDQKSKNNDKTIPLVSIITVVYNAEQTIEQTILSVFAQTYPKIEYIMIDGCSKDKTIDIIKKYNNKITKWISEPDNGISDAFNKGIKLASGSLIGILNADDWYEADTIEQIVNCYIDDNTIICANVKLHNNSKKYTIKKSTINGIKTRMNIWHPGMFCPKEIYERIGLYNKNIQILMDYDFVIRCYLAGIEFKFIDKIAVNMRYGGLSNIMISKSMKEALSIKNKYFNNPLKHKIEYYFFSFYYQSIIFIKNLIYQK